MPSKGKLFLIPCPIADETVHAVTPPYIKEELKHIRTFLVEDLRSARRFLGSLKIYDAVENLDMHLLNKDTGEAQVAAAFKTITEGEDIGVISEAGSPGVADPGALAVRYAHAHDIQVVPMVGPSSLILALMASGLNGQQFAFHGYLPIDVNEAGRKVKELERESRTRKQTQMFIEAPHRNNSIFKVLLQSLSPGTLLSVALDITGKDEQIKTRTIEDWAIEKPQWPKIPAIFLFLA